MEKKMIESERGLVLFENNNIVCMYDHEDADVGTEVLHMRDVTIMKALQILDAATNGSDAPRSSMAQVIYDGYATDTVIEWYTLVGRLAERERERMKAYGSAFTRIAKAIASVTDCEHYSYLLSCPADEDEESSEANAFRELLLNIGFPYDSIKKEYDDKTATVDVRFALEYFDEK